MGNSHATGTSRPSKDFERPRPKKWGRQSPRFPWQWFQLFPFIWISAGFYMYSVYMYYQNYLVYNMLSRTYRDVTWEAHDGPGCPLAGATCTPQVRVNSEPAWWYLLIGSFFSLIHFLLLLALLAFAEETNWFDFIKNLASIVQNIHSNAGLFVT